MILSYIRTVILYLVLILVIRLMGKRQIGEMEPAEFVVTMTVKYTNSWNDYVLEKKYAEQLIREGCVIISQHSDTAGPAVACEQTDSSQIVPDRSHP